VLNRGFAPHRASAARLEFVDGSAQLCFVAQPAPKAAKGAQQLRLAAADGSAALPHALACQRQAATVLMLGVLQRGDCRLQRTVLNVLRSSTESEPALQALVDGTVEGIATASRGRVKLGRRHWLRQGWLPWRAPACIPPASSLPSPACPHLCCRSLRL
jgi:hypothetical protein